MTVCPITFHILFTTSQKLPLSCFQKRNMKYILWTCLNTSSGISGHKCNSLKIPNKPHLNRLKKEMKTSLFITIKLNNTKGYILGEEVPSLPGAVHAVPAVRGSLQSTPGSWARGRPARHFVLMAGTKGWEIVKGLVWHKRVRFKRCSLICAGKPWISLYFFHRVTFFEEHKELKLNQERRFL